MVHLQESVRIIVSLNWILLHTIQSDLKNFDAGWKIYVRKFIWAINELYNMSQGRTIMHFVTYID